MRFCLRAPECVETPLVHLVGSAAACVKFSWFRHVSRHNPPPPSEARLHGAMEENRGEQTGGGGEREEFPDPLSINYIMTRQWDNNFVELPDHPGIDPP